MSERIDALGDKAKAAYQGLKQHAQNAYATAQRYEGQARQKAEEARQEHRYQVQQANQATKERHKYAPQARHLQQGVYQLGYGAPHHSKMHQYPEHSNPNLKKGSYTQQEVNAIVRYEQNQKKMPNLHKHMKKLNRYPNPFALR